MSSFNQVTIGGYSGGGLTTDKKPLMLANEAFSVLENAYVFRDRTKKRNGTVNIGRLRRLFTNQSLGTSSASPWSFNLYSILSITPEMYAEIAEGTTVLTIGTLKLVDQSNGNLSQTGLIIGATNANPCKITSTAHHLTNGDMIIVSGVSGMTQLNGNTYTITVVDANNFTIGVNSTAYGVYSSGGSWISLSNYGTITYITGDVVITYDIAPAAAHLSFGYYPSLPCMGICKRDTAQLGIDATVFFDTKYAYQYVTGGFQELSTGTVWTAADLPNFTNTNFFYAANYQGATPDLKYFFVTNNNINIPATLYDPIYYYNNSSWTSLQPLTNATNTLWQSLILVPYYGRMLALNTWEGLTASTYTGAANFFSRCRFSQIGDPTDATNAWREDIFGRGGFIDAPTNEQIVGAAFHRNSLIVFFEYSTWQLRYVGEYGLPFIFERISSDFGSVCTFSNVIFDQGVMTVGDRAIINASESGVTRLDNQIPETVFSFEIQNNAPDFVHGIRDYEKELVYWNYVDVSDQADMNQGEFQNWPNSVLLFNYQNNTWAQFRDSITCFGISQFQFGITWDSVTTFWDSDVSWDNVDDQQYVDYVTCGNQQGFIAIYENQDAATDTPYPSITMFGPSLAITAFSFVSPTQLTVPNHNLADGELIYLQGTLWSGSSPAINNAIYQIKAIDVDTITLASWDQTNLNYVDENFTSGTYIGGGVISLLPVMNIQGKDFNPYQGEGNQFKLSFIDFQMDSNLNEPAIPAVTVQLFVNSYLGEQANMMAGICNQELLNSSQNRGLIQFVYTGADTPTNPSNPCQVKSINHSLATGTEIYIANVVGTTQINATIYTITVVDANNFTLNGFDATGWTAYKSGGIWNTSPIDGQTYTPGAQYAWYRFYSNQFGQYLRIGITYDDTLLNQVSTHQLPMELNAMNCWFRKGGRLVN